MLVFGERHDLLRLTVIEELKVGLRETSNRPAVLVHDDCVDLDEVRSGAEHGLLRRRFGAALRGQNHSQRRGNRDGGC